MRKLGLLLTLIAVMATSANAGYWRSTPNIFGGYDYNFDGYSGYSTPNIFGAKTLLCFHLTSEKISREIISNIPKEIIKDLIIHKDILGSDHAPLSVILRTQAVLILLI